MRALNAFLKECKVGTGEDCNFAKMQGGSLWIPEERSEEFFELYAAVGCPSPLVLKALLSFREYDIK